MEGKRFANVNRKTNETDVKLEIHLDGSTSTSNISTGVPFLDHMLQLWAKHGGFYLKVNAQGDTHVDYHHTVEDVGICLGKVFNKCLHDKKGITRYGHAVIPMDEALVLTAVDISGRGFLACELQLPAEKVGDFDTELIEEFLRALAINSEITLHVRQISGRNCHHIIEALFKGLGRSMGQAALIGCSEELLSTKGLL
ncbi:MAG: imidazoleglycerol-phosphate dehydratase HisB [Clostridiales bacterium]|nr:imidazoleglycerol-phosphate dehydratase HisB [Clostridiales bacterium]MCF8021678.1 imidazoleglycerol-phosphate dehydratase HisB [Clostridiales bacterium]